MKIINFYFLILLLFINYCSVENENTIPYYIKQGKYQGEYYPRSEWRECSPEEVGMSTENLKRVYDYAINPNITTQALLIIRKGYIVFELYLNGFSKNTGHYSYSVAKSFSSALIGIAYDKGYIKDLNSKIINYYKNYEYLFNSEYKRNITIKNILTMTSGIEWNEEGYDRPENDVWIMIEEADDYFDYILSKPMRYEPGTDWNYSSGDSMLLSNVIKNSTGKTPFEFAKENLFNKIGINDISWEEDEAGHTITAWGILTTARNFAKFGYLYLKKGKWENEQIISKTWITESLKPVYSRYKELDIIDFYGYQWWLLPALKNYKKYNLPQSTYLAWGLYTQQIFIIPEKDLLIVRLGHDTNADNDEWREAEFLNLVITSIN